MQNDLKTAENRPQRAWFQNCEKFRNIPIKRVTMPIFQTNISAAC